MLQKKQIIGPMNEKLLLTTISKSEMKVHDLSGEEHTIRVKYHKAYINGEQHVRKGKRTKEMHKEPNYFVKSYFSMDCDCTPIATHEHSIISMLNHPGIVKSFGTTSSNTENDRGIIKDVFGAAYSARIFLEYIPGPNLTHYISSNTLETNEKIRIIKELTNIFQYMTEQKIIYADYKPENIMINKDGSGINYAGMMVKLVDFEISIIRPTVYDAPEGQEHRYGTKLYITPERTTEPTGKKIPRISEASEVQSLARVFFQLITGQKANMPDTHLKHKEIYTLISQGNTGALYLKQRKTLKGQLKDHKELADLIHRSLDARYDQRPSVDEFCKTIRDI